MYSLPAVPGFPVYGLPPAFTGMRWLVVWQNRSQLYEVTLGHGEPPSPPSPQVSSWIGVTTCLKAKRVPSAPGVFAGPVGLEEAAIHALMRMADLTWPGGHEAQSAEIANVDAGADKIAPFAGWTDGTVRVDGVECEARRRDTERAWAVVVDLPRVAVGMSGPRASDAFTAELVDVTQRLDDYV